MKNDFTGFAKHQKEKLDKYFRKDEELTFKKIAVEEDNFYFIYKSKAVILKDKIASYELIPSDLSTTQMMNTITIHLTATAMAMKIL